MVAAPRLDPLTMSNLGFGLVALLLVAIPARVAAEPAAAKPDSVTQQVSLHYLGEAGCPSEAEFVEEVTARVRRPVEWTQSGAAVQMVVIVRRAGDRASGTLEVVQRSTEPTRREFNSSSCAEVASALALVAALALDPNARTEVLPSHAQGAQPSAPTPEAAPVPPRASSSETKRVTRAASTPAPSRPPARGSHYLAWLGPAATVASGYASEPLVAVGLILGARAVRPGFSPGFQLTPAWGKTGTTGPAAAGGSFSWAIARLEACPVRLALARPLTLEPCAAAELGRVSARGESTGIVPVNAERWWFAAGATLSLHVSFGAGFARLGTLVLFPATRYEFVFRDPDRTIDQADVVSVGGTLGLGFQFGS
jgi:hypothetical protein